MANNISAAISDISRELVSEALGDQEAQTDNKLNAVQNEEQEPEEDLSDPKLNAVQNENPEQEDEEPPESTGEITDLNGLVEAIQVDPEFLYGLNVPMADGEPPIKLGELKDALTAAKRESRDLAQKLEQVGNVQVPDAGPDLQRWSQDMINAHGIMTALQHQYQSMNWSDPDADKGELAHYKQQLIEAFSNASNQFQGAAQQHQQTMSQAMNAYKQAEAGKLFSKIPEWKSEEVFNKDRDLIRQVAGQYGFTPEELSQIMDHRALVAFRDLARLKSAQAETAKAVKQVQKAPKVLGTRTRKQPTQNIDKLIQRARTANAKTRGAAEVAAAKAILLGG